MVFCSNCGNELSSYMTASFCTECGSSITKDNSSSAAAEQNPQNNQSEYCGKNKVQAEISED